MGKKDNKSGGGGGSKDAGKGGKGGKGKGGGGDDSGGKQQKGAQSINVRHILVSFIFFPISVFTGGGAIYQHTYLPNITACWTTRN